MKEEVFSLDSMQLCCVKNKIKNFKHYILLKIISKILKITYIIHGGQNGINKFSYYILLFFGV